MDIFNIFYENDTEILDMDIGCPRRRCQRGNYFWNLDEHKIFKALD